MLFVDLRSWNVNMPRQHIVELESVISQKTNLFSISQTKMHANSQLKLYFVTYTSCCSQIASYAIGLCMVICQLQEFDAIRKHRFWLGNLFAGLWCSNVGHISPIMEVPYREILRSIRMQLRTSASLSSSAKSQDSCGVDVPQFWEAWSLQRQKRYYITNITTKTWQTIRSTFTCP